MQKTGNYGKQTRDSLENGGNYEKRTLSHRR